jgi:hypothetical protein
MVQDLTCDRLMIPNVSIIDMNMNVRTVTLDQEHYWIYVNNTYRYQVAAMDVVVLGLKHVNVLKPSGHHRHCSGTTCLKESVTCGQRPLIRRQWNLDRVCWVLDLAEEHWSLSETDALLLYTLFGLGRNHRVSCASDQGARNSNLLLLFPLSFFLDFLFLKF